MIEQFSGLYSQLDRNYAQALSGPYEDLSLTSNDGEVVAAVKDNRITGFWRPAVILGDDDFQRTQIERLWSRTPDITLLDFLIGGQLSQAGRFLLKEGFVAEPKFVQTVDLWKNQDQLWSDVRRSYRSLIHADLNRVVLCKTQKQWADYMRLHAKVAGRQTRPKTTWEIQWLMHEAKEAFTVLLYDENSRDLVAGAMFMHNRYRAYYASAKSVDQQNSHALLWKAVEIAKDKGIHFLDFGEQVFSGDPKAISISAFKAGFSRTTQVQMLIRPRQRNER